MFSKPNIISLDIILKLTSTQSSTHTTLDPTLWPRLPLDILSVTIENTADRETLEICRQAIKDSSSLRHVAIWKSYKTHDLREKLSCVLPRLVTTIRTPPWETMKRVTALPIGPDDQSANSSLTLRGTPIKVSHHTSGACTSNSILLRRISKKI